MSIYYWDDVILFVDGQIAMHEDCCCEEGTGGPCGCIGDLPETINATFAGISDCEDEIQDCEDDYSIVCENVWNDTHAVSHWEECIWKTVVTCCGTEENPPYRGAHMRINIGLVPLTSPSRVIVSVEVLLQCVYWAAVVGQVQILFEKTIHSDELIDCTDLGSIPKVDVNYDGDCYCDVSSMTCVLS